MSRPLCRYCGKPLKKRAINVVFNSGKGTWHNSGRPERPTTKEEAQKLFNQEITSVKYAEDEKGRYVSEIFLWDGESYIGKFFCKNDHAISFANGVFGFNPDLGTKDYHDAIAAQKEE